MIKWIVGGAFGLMGIVGCFVVAQVMAFQAMWYMMPKLIPAVTTIKHNEALDLPQAVLSGGVSIDPAKCVQPVRSAVQGSKEQLQQAGAQQ